VQEVVLRTRHARIAGVAGDDRADSGRAVARALLPRDLYPLGGDDDPMSAVGEVEAAQRGLNSGLCYFHLDEPAFGSVLYFQNLTALNDYFRATDTKPDGRSAANGPRSAICPPTPPQSGTPPTDPLPAGKPVTMSDAILVFHDGTACDEQDSAQPLPADARHGLSPDRGAADRPSRLGVARRRRCAISKRRPRRRSGTMATSISIPTPRPNIPMSWCR
jgi:hypothetical protein